MNFDYFEIKKWMLEKDRMERVDGKDGVNCLVSMFTFRVMVLTLPKKVSFLEFCADLSKKPKSIK